MGAYRNTEKEILGLAKEQGVLRVRDVVGHNIHPEYVRRLCAKGLLKRAGRGRYVTADADITEYHSLALTAKSVPRGVFCLLTALQFHGIGTQMPHEVWIAVEKRDTRPRIEYPRLRVFRFSGKAFTHGVEHHKIQGVLMNIYSPAKTVADCFKYRNKIGLDVALEALKEGRRAKKFTSDEIWISAKVCRVANVMRPYLEAIV
jgi:predicted transcriptional regulator of viral defense system